MLYLASQGLLGGKVNYKLMRDVTVAAILMFSIYKQKQSARLFPNVLKICLNFAFKISCLKTETLFGP